MLHRVALVRTDVSEERIIFLLRSVLRLLVTADISSSMILVTLMMEAIRFSETSVLTRVTLRNIPEDGILQSHRRENLKSYVALIGSVDDILHSHRRENLKFYIALTSSAL
jgi:hypothetical protein